jgi:Zn-finger nucleic acid-binding protein
MFQGAQFCPHCGAATETLQVGPEGARHCPQCKETKLQRITVGAVQLEECLRCGGLWVDTKVFERICSDQAAQTAAIGLRLPPPVADDGRVHYRKCPQCSQLMRRTKYASRLGVIIDVCRPHGVWLDRDELRRIIEFIRSGGLERQRQIEMEELERQRNQLEAQQRTSDTGGGWMASSDSSAGLDSGDLLGGIASVLLSLIK